MVHCCIVVLCLLATGASAEVLKAPPPGPVTVKVGLAIHFDNPLSSSTYFHHLQEWKDPPPGLSLQQTPRRCQRSAPASSGCPGWKLSMPSITNCSPRRSTSVQRRHGHCKSHFSATLTSQMNLKRFSITRTCRLSCSQPCRGPIPLIWKPTPARLQSRRLPLRYLILAPSTAQISKSKADPILPRGSIGGLQAPHRSQCQFLCMEGHLADGRDGHPLVGRATPQADGVEAALSVSVTLLVCTVAFGISVTTRSPASATAPGSTTIDRRASS